MLLGYERLLKSAMSGGNSWKETRQSWEGVSDRMHGKKTISVVIPTYNEEKNILMDYERVKRVFDESLPCYGWKILFIDNHSTDSTRDAIRALGKKDERVQAIFNGKNYGFERSSYYGLVMSQGDASVLLYSDLQDPPEVIPQMVEQWERGHPVVCGQKRSNAENVFVEAARKAYYGLLDRISENGHIPQYNGFGLYDRSFLDVLASIRDPLPYFRGMVAEFAPNVALVPYDHMERESGESKFSLARMADYALVGITSSSKAAMRLSSIIGWLVVEEMRINI